MKNIISRKLILAVGSVTITIFAIFSYYIISSQKRALISQIDLNAHQVSETVKSSTKFDMLLNRREHLHRIIDTIGQQDGIEKVRIFNKEGEIIYSSAKVEVGRFVDKQAEACYACHAADQPLEKLSIPERTRIFTIDDTVKTLGIINPIYNEASCWQSSCHAHDANQKVLGVLDVTMSLDEVDRQIRADQIQMMVFAFCVSLVISFILWFLVQKLIGRPVRQLVKATNIVAAGDLDYKIKSVKRDELGYLGNSFNEMTHKLAETQRQLYQSDKLASLGRLAAGVAHEINNPLTGVLTYSSFLLKRADDDGEMKKDLETIVRETKRCRGIVKGLLDFARQVPVRKIPVDFNKVINRTLKIVDNQLSFNNIVVHKNIKENLPTFNADANQMEQVLINLIVNSADAIGKKGGEIFISTNLQKIDGEKVIEIKVRDTGCGIPRENLTKIFEPFYTTNEQKGTGLGLAVVWGIIDKHAGKIAVNSKLGMGTTFTIRFPISENTALIVEKNHHED